MGLSVRSERIVNNFLFLLYASLTHRLILFLNTAEPTLRWTLTAKVQLLSSPEESGAHATKQDRRDPSIRLPCLRRYTKFFLPRIINRRGSFSRISSARIICRRLQSTSNAPWLFSLKGLLYRFSTSSSRENRARSSSCGYWVEMFFSLDFPKFMFLYGKKRGLRITILYLVISLLSEKYKNF